MPDPRQDIEGDGELRSRVECAVQTALMENSDTHVVVDEVVPFIADAVLGLFGDVERELARLREAARAVVENASSLGNVQVGRFRDAIIALCDVLAAQSEHPKQ